MGAGAVPSPRARAAYQFGGFTLDLSRGALFDAQGGELQLRPKIFALLRHLVENAGRLISRDEILAAVWPGVIVTNDSVTLCVRQLRAALGDPGGKLLRTVPRRGYLFAAEVARSEAIVPAPTIPPEETAHPRGTAAEPRTAASRPMLVVLPFVNMTGDPGQEYFADGITEELTTALSHLRWFSVIARNSAFTYKGKAVDVRRVGRELGAGYVLEGSVRKAGGKVRITVQLCEAEAGAQVWAQRFDGDMADIFGIQDHITEAVVGAVEPRLKFAEVERTRARPTESLTAYDLYLRALPHRYTMRGDNDEVLRLLRHAVALDPGFVAAKGALAGLHVIRVSQGWANGDDVAEAVRCAREVAESGGDDPSALAWAAYALALVGREHEAALAVADRALAMAPNSATNLYVNAAIRAFVGDAETAIFHLERAMRLSPVDPVRFYFFIILSLAHFIAGRYEDAVEWARRGLRDRPTFLAAHRLLAASLAQLGRLDEAAGAVQALLAIAPGYTIARAAAHIGLRHPPSLRAVLDGLRRAGLPLQ